MSNDIDDEIDLSEVDPIDGDWIEYLSDPTIALDPSRRGLNGCVVKSGYYDELIEPELITDDEKMEETNLYNDTLPSVEVISGQDLLNRIGLNEDPNSNIQDPITREMLLKRIGLTEEQLGYGKRGTLK